jgi:hypothetical protein
MNTPYWFVGEYYDSCRSVIREMENNQRLLLIIKKNGLQVLTKNEQHYFWDNLNEFRQDVWDMSQFLQSVKISEEGKDPKDVI